MVVIATMQAEQVLVEAAFLVKAAVRRNQCLLCGCNYSNDGARQAAMMRSCMPERTTAASTEPEKQKQLAGDSTLSSGLKTLGVVLGWGWPLLASFPETAVLLVPTHVPQRTVTVLYNDYDY